jgi:hypothetical protein
MHPLRTDLFRRFALSLIVVFALFSAPHCISSLIVSDVYAQSNDETVIAEEEQTASQTTQERSEAVSDAAKDDKTKDSKTTE